MTLFKLWRADVAAQRDRDYGKHGYPHWADELVVAVSGGVAFFVLLFFYLVCRWDGEDFFERGRVRA